MVRNGESAERLAPEHDMVQYHEENSLYAIQLMTEDVEREGRSAEERESALFQLSRNSRIAAISALLGRADVTAFHERLKLSGSWRLRMLRERAARARPFSRYSCTGSIAPLCDALAAGADVLARDIALASSPTWLERKEFEDDFHYGRMLCRFASEEVLPAVAAEENLNDLVRSTGDDQAPRVRACQALLIRDPQAFDEALRELLEQHGAWFRARVGTFQARDPWFETERYVCVEALALVWLAQQRGMALEEAEYPFLPSITRVHRS